MDIAETPRIVDCTIRDGGLVNDFAFSVEFVRDVYRALDAARVDYMEVGYKNARDLVPDGANSGPWRFLTDDLVREAIPTKGRTKLSAMVDVGRTSVSAIRPRAESPIDLMRVACYVQEVPAAVEMVDWLHGLGYETTVNIMAVSHAVSAGIDSALEKLNASKADVIYVVDSFGSLFGDEVADLVRTYRRFLPNKTLGIHTHNNLQHAFSNTLTAAKVGTQYLDCSIYGLGRSSGNCPTELLVSVLENQGYVVRPIIDVIQQRFIPLKAEIEWGYQIPYAITGMLNHHPRPAMALHTSARKHDFTGLYDTLAEARA